MSKIAYSGVATMAELPKLNSNGSVTTTLHKTIYRNGADPEPILKLEIETHLRLNPTLEFSGFAAHPVKNSDGSTTHTMFFHTK